MRTTKGQRRITWEVKLRLTNGYDKPVGYYMNKQQLKKWLLDFKSTDWPQYDIKSVIIIRSKCTIQPSHWKDEIMGYTDVLPCGTLAYIDI